MTDRWARAEERYRQQEADRRYRRDDRVRGGRGNRGRVVGTERDEWDDYEDDTTVIPRYIDEEPEPAPPPRPPAPQRRAAQPTQGRGAGRSRAAAEQPERPRRSAPQRGRRSRVASRKAAERKRRRRNLWVIAAVFVILFAGAAGFAGWKLIDRFGDPEDFAGPPGPPVVVQVHSGDTASQIADAMLSKGVVASSAAFYEAAIKNDSMSAVQPGYYQIPSHSPAKAAVAALVAPASRVGNVVISPGRQLHDTHDVNTGARYDGIYRKIADASCIGAEPNRTCTSYEQLDAAGAGPDLVALGVPDWAAQSVRAVADRNRQLEGLVAAGTLDFDPSGTPEQILGQLISQSSRSFEATGLVQSGAANGLSAYETLVAASLVQREALPQDMPKVARVIVNRLRVDQPLQFDSTVNYALDRTEVATTNADRAKPTPWNTYAMPGLPVTPICAPSPEALGAMEKPAAGPWLYFVTVDKQGTTVFTDSYTEHLGNIEQALESGILDSGR